MNLRWLYSGTYRRTSDVVKQVEKLYHAQQDILAPSAAEALLAEISAARLALKSGASDEILKQHTATLEEVAVKWIRPYPHAEYREYVEMFLVAIVVAMGVRTFFLQPFKIPTGSMEPTLYGIEIEDLRNRPDVKTPTTLGRVWDAVYHGAFYQDFEASEDGEVTELGPLEHVARFVNKQTFWVRYQNQGRIGYTVYFGQDQMDRSGHMVGISPGLFNTPFKKGEPILRYRESAGDHLFVDRLSYNFRHPNRGDIVVFKTSGIAGIPDQGQFYIKRLVGLPGETISIGDDQHVRINGSRLDATTPHFENVYGFDPKEPGVEGRFGKYSGHLLEPGSLLRSPTDTLQIPPKNFVVFGDNTRNSLDSRYWGFVPQENVIGKSFFVYWPISARFGWNSTGF